MLLPNAPWRPFVPGQPIKALLDFFSNIWLGVTLLVILFVYCSIGSAGVPTRLNIFAPAAWRHVRTARGIELTEFEWFHWWPFDLIIALICITLTVTTIRRIPLKVINLGVWMIHSGIIILALGSVIYFGTKVEGDSPVARRQVEIKLPDGQTRSLMVKPGNQVSLVTQSGRYTFQITSIDPQWELLSGADKGKKTYSVNLSVQTPQMQFIRQLIAGFPQYTEDLIRTDDPNQPFQRAVKATGTPLVDDTLDITLAYNPEKHFYLVNTRAIYLRTLGSREWIERPIESMPRFNEYFSSHDDVWLASNDLMPRLDPIDIAVPSVDERDPLAGVDLHVTGFLPYAFEQTRRIPGGATLDPLVRLRIENTSGGVIRQELAAFDPASHSDAEGLLHFVWADSPAAVERFQEIRDPLLTIRIPEMSIEINHAISETTALNPELEFTIIEGTDFSFRVNNFQDGLSIRPGITDSLAIIEIQSPEKTFTRWVFADPKFTRDLPMQDVMGGHDEEIPVDDRIITTYTPGRRPAPLTIVAGPREEDLHLLTTLSPGTVSFQQVRVGEKIEFAPGNSLTVESYHARTKMVTKPAITPRAQRDPQMTAFLSMLRISLPDSGQVQSTWLGYHHYPFASGDETLRRFAYQPALLTLADGRRIEIMFSRQRRLLPAAVALDDFRIDTHIGGFTGQTSSILDWISLVRFQDKDGWTEPMEVRVNAPQEHRGLWFFQAQWDPPDPPRFQGDVGSNGLNYTVLGVGNRNGVAIQLLGCCIAVFGMIFAFYVKPILKRRHQNAVLARPTDSHAESELEENAALPEREPVTVGMEESP